MTPGYTDAYGGRRLSDEEARSLGVQPEPTHREMIHWAALYEEMYPDGTPRPEPVQPAPHPRDTAPFLPEDTDEQ